MSLADLIPIRDCFLKGPYKQPANCSELPLNSYFFLTATLWCSIIGNFCKLDLSTQRHRSASWLPYQGHKTHFM